MESRTGAFSIILLFLSFSLSGMKPLYTRKGYGYAGSPGYFGPLSQDSQVHRFEESEIFPLEVNSDSEGTDSNQNADSPIIHSPYPCSCGINFVSNLEKMAEQSDEVQLLKTQIKEMSDKIRLMSKQIENTRDRHNNDRARHDQDMVAFDYYIQREAKDKVDKSTEFLCKKFTMLERIIGRRQNRFDATQKALNKKINQQALLISALQDQVSALQ